MSLVFFFFFQAEDGIRDIGVTGVQTCALPISHKLEMANNIRVVTRYMGSGINDKKLAWDQGSEG